MDVAGIRQCASSIEQVGSGLGASGSAVDPGALEPPVARALSELIAAEAQFTTRAAARLVQVSRRLNDVADGATSSDRFPAP